MSLILFICQRKKAKKRSGGNKNYIKLIRNYQKNRIWFSLSKQITLEEIKALSITFNIPESTIRSWNKSLLENRYWLPLHIRSPILPSHMENLIAELLMEIIDQGNTAITDKLVKQIVSNYHSQLITNLSSEQLREQNIPLRFSATSKSFFAKKVPFQKETR